MSLVERVHTATADCVPQFDVAIQAARSIQTSGGRIFHTGDARCVLLRWNGTGKTLTGVDIIYAQYLVIGANHHVVTSRMERQTTNGNTILKKHIFNAKLARYVYSIVTTHRHHFVGLLHGRLGYIEQFDRTIARCRC